MIQYYTYIISLSKIVEDFHIPELKYLHKTKHIHIT